MRKTLKSRNSRKNHQAGDDNGKLRAVGYGRCSTEEQHARSEYNTLESQRDYVAGYIKAVHPEWEMNGWYEDPGYSGKDTKRPGIQALLLDAEKCKFDVVVVYKLDRITRSLADFFELDKFLSDHGVRFISVKEQFDTSTAMGRAMRNIALTFAELEREMVAERVKDKMIAIVKRGKWPGGVAPFGYEIKDGKLCVDPVEGPAVRRMFETYALTKSVAAVRDRMAASGILPNTRFPKGSDRTPCPLVWNNHKVSYILRNRTYLGLLHYDGIEVPDTHEPLVDPDLFDRAQAIISQGYRKPRLSADHDYFLGGKVHCADCGCRLTPKSTNHPGRSKAYTPYYECYRLSKYRGYPCSVKRINAEVLERLFLETIQKLVWDRQMLAEAVAQLELSDQEDEELKARESDCTQRLTQLDAKLQNILTAVENGLAGSSLQERIRELESQQAILKGELAEIRTRRKQTKKQPITVDEAVELFGKYSELFKQATAEEKEALTDAVLKNAVVYADKNVEFELYVGQDPCDVVQNVRFGSPEGIRTLDLMAENHVILPLHYLRRQIHDLSSNHLT